MVSSSAQRILFSSIRSSVNLCVSQSLGYCNGRTRDCKARDDEGKRHQDLEALFKLS